jgi:hypothetical protein
MNEIKLSFDHEFGEYSLCHFVGFEQVETFLTHEHLLDLVASTNKSCLRFQFLQTTFISHPFSQAKIIFDCKTVHYFLTWISLTV